MRIKQPICLIIFLTASTLVQAEDLLQIYDIAYCNDPTLEVAKQTHLAAREALPQAISQFLPVVSATAQHLYYNTSTLVSGVSHAFSNQYSVILNQPIYRFDFWAQHAQATEAVLAANYTYAAAEQELILRTSERYFGVLSAIDNLHFAKAQREAFGRFLYQTEQRYKVGLIAITDVEIARARHDNALAQEITAQNNLYDQRELLREITCLKIDEICPLKDSLPISPPEGNVEQWVSKALEQNLELQAACYTAGAAKANIKVQRSGHLPRVNFIAEYDKNGPINPIISSSVVNDTFAGLQVQLPIYNGGGITSRVRQSMHNYLRSDGEHERLYRQIKSNTRQFYRGIQTQIEQVDALGQAVISNRSAVKATEESFNVGTRTIVDVLDSQRDLIQAETDLANAKYQYILNTLRLKRAAGMLCPVDLERVNTWLKKCKSSKNACPVVCPPDLSAPDDPSNQAKNTQHNNPSVKAKAKNLAKVRSR